jgi:hypothetical protein
MTNKAGQQRSIADSIRRVVNIARIIGIVVLLAIVATGVRQLIAFYSDEVGLSAPAAAEAYTRALLSGNLDAVYATTDKTSVTDLYGRPIERIEFMDEVRRVIGTEPLPAQGIKVSKLFDKDGMHYYRVDITFTSTVPPLGKSLLLQLHNVDGSWLVVWPFGLAS